MKRKLTASAMIAICLSMLGFGSLAYFNAKDVARNVITSGSIEIELQEWANDEKTIPFPEEGITGVMPGTVVTKIAEVKNTGGNDAWIRVEVLPTITLATGEEGDPKLVSINFDKENWTKGKDGYYYYKAALKPGKTTESLFTEVTFDTSMGNPYEKSKVEIQVNAYAVQTANNGTDVMEANGWPKEGNETET